jgi:hypothetical protein
MSLEPAPTWACPVCGFALAWKPYATWPPPAGAILAPPYPDQLGAASYGICGRCGYEFGFDDDPGGSLVGQSFEDYRAEWLADRG